MCLLFERRFNYTNININGYDCAQDHDCRPCRGDHRDGDVVSGGHQFWEFNSCTIELEHTGSADAVEHRQRQNYQTRQLDAAESGIQRLERPGRLDSAPIRAHRWRSARFAQCDQRLVSDRLSSGQIQLHHGNLLLPVQH